jgi:glutamine cyclotransferase
MRNRPINFAVTLFLALLIASISGCSGAPETPDASNLTDGQESNDITYYTYRVLNSYPHDPGAFTQGLVMENNILYEGTGRYGQSSIRKVTLETGEIWQQVELSDEYFGEGITVFGDNLIQLTWQANTGFVYDKESLELIRTFDYPTEGWGITHDDTHLIMSDGTSTLYFLHPETFEVVRRVQVHDSGDAIDQLNELEYIHGEIYANVWRTDHIVIIDPDDGSVTGLIDLTGLLDEELYGDEADVLNGIAYDAENDRLFVTGKLWPFLFEVELVPRGTGE